MRRDLMLLFVAFVFLLAACATPVSQSERVAAAGSGVGSTSALPAGHAGGMIGEYMERQERELTTRLAKIEGASIERREGNLSLTFRCDLFFDPDSARMQPSAQKGMEDICDILVRYPDTQLKIDGHSDGTGTEEHNYQLSEMRAKAVRDALVERGVHPSRIVARGWGESKPVASNATDAGRRQNSRVTLLIFPAQL
jgi:outer membrane protein OmpA-like peptidoglycan-associated protein